MNRTRRWFGAFVALSGLFSAPFVAQAQEPVTTTPAASASVDSGSTNSAGAPTATATGSAPNAASNASAAPMAPRTLALPPTLAPPTPVPPTLVPPTLAPPTLAPPAPPPMRPVESDLVSLADRDGFRWQTRNGDFQFHPYALLQTHLQATTVANRWLALTDQDEVRGLGFGVSYGLIGVAATAFRRVSTNLAVNAACAGGCLLNQAWLQVEVSRGLKIQAGKFKTPMHRSFLVRIGETQLPRLPSSLTSRVTLPFGLNSLPPTLGLGFDVGIMAHGSLGEHAEYQAGVFNGEGIGVNTPTSTLSDDSKVPGLLYAARLAYHPLGAMRPREGGPGADAPTRLLVAASGSHNVEANAETTNDTRAAVELAVTHRRLYAAVEGYLLHMNFVERQRGQPSRLFYGAYAQAGVSIFNGLEPVFRFEVFDRNSTSDAGMTLIGTAGLNWYVEGQNMKLQLMYQRLFRTGYPTEEAAHQDDNALPDNTAVAQLQFVL